MAKMGLLDIIGDNLRFFMARSTNCKNPNALHQEARRQGKRISANTVRYLLDNSKRTTTTEKPEGYPTLDKLEVATEVLGIQVWELLHPDIERSLKERDYYARSEQSFAETDTKRAAAHPKIAALPTPRREIRPPNDMTLLTKSIQDVEQYLKNKKEALTADLKAELVSLVYKDYADNIKADQPTVAKHYLRLVR